MQGFTLELCGRDRVGLLLDEGAPGARVQRWGREARARQEAAIGGDGEGTAGGGGGGASRA
jgi:hypothetical protein